MSATLSIAGTPYPFIEDILDLINRLDERQRFKVDVFDVTGTAHFLKGQLVTLTDPLLGLMYAGVLNSDKEVDQYPSGAILHSIDCIDIGQWIAGKRTYTRTYTTPQAAGKLAVDMLSSVLVPEGIAQNFALGYDTAQPDFAQGILSSTVATNNVTDGDLELAAAGSNVTIVESTTAQFASGTLTSMTAASNSLTPTTVNALKMQSTLSFAYGVEFAQNQQTASGTASGTVSGTASGTASGSTDNFTPAGSISISSGSPGESASFSGYGMNAPVSSLSVSAPFSTPFSTPVSATVTATYQPKTKSKVRIDATHYGVVTVDVAVADNRVDAVIWTGSFTVGSNDTLNYDIWIASTSPSQEGGVDLHFSDGTAMTQYLGSLDTNTDVGLWDQIGVSASPITDLSQDAKDVWYTRQINLSILTGKTITSVSVFNAANIAGTFDLYIKNCYLGSQSGSPFFGTTQTTPTVNPPTVTSIGAYVTAATLTTVVAVYLPATASRISPAYSIDAVKLVKNSLVTWSASIPASGPGVIAGTPGAAATPGSEALFVSYDGTTWLPCTNNQPLPGLPAGANVAGGSLYLLETFSGGQDPTAIPALLSVTITLVSAVNATTTDIVSLYGSATAWNTGTKIGTAVNANGDLALGLTSYSWANLGNMTWVPGFTNFSGSTATNPTQSVSAGAYTISTATTGGSNGNAWSSTRFNFIAAAQDFTVQADFTLSGSSPLQNEIGFVYRQTYWGSPNNSFAYYVRVMQAPGGQAGGTSVTLGYGINNPPSAGVGGAPASGTFTVITQVAETISSGTTYHLKLVAGNNRHTIYWNNGSTPIIDILDNTYTGAGNIGLRTYVQSSNSATSKIANFTVTNTFAGLWTSAPISLNSLGTCGNTQLSWSEVTAANAIQSTAIVMSSLNGGSTWQQCTNGAVVPTAIIPGLPVGTNVVGKSLTLQVILSTTGFLTLPIITGLAARVCGAYPAVSGSRSTIPLGNDLMVRANQSGLGTAFDGQTWAKVGTGTDAIAANAATISNTTGDVHEVLGSRTGTDEEATVRFQLSASTIAGGIELRYVDANNYYRFSASSTTYTLLKRSASIPTTLATAAATLSIGTWYRMRFRVVGSNPVLLFAKVWADGVLEPGSPSAISTNWTLIAMD